MPEVLQVILYFTFSGNSVFFDGILSYFFGKNFKEDKGKKEINHFVIAFGGGIILAALAQVLIPIGIEELKLFPLLLCFIAGTIIFSS